jgi:hypothetical protein
MSGFFHWYIIIFVGFQCVVCFFLLRIYVQLHRQVNTLVFQSNRLTCEGAKLLADALSSMPSLTDLVYLALTVLVLISVFVFKHNAFCIRRKTRLLMGLWITLSCGYCRSCRLILSLILAVTLLPRHCGAIKHCFHCNWAAIALAMKVCFSWHDRYITTELSRKSV